jgi:serine protease Do
MIRLLCAAIVAAGGLPADGPANADPRAQRRTPVVEVFERARDAVVNISSKEIIEVRSAGPFDRFFEDLFDMPSRPHTRQFTRQSVGSGFVIHPGGYIATNAHVVSRTAERKVIFADGREYDAQVVAHDTARDLALLKIDADSALPTLPLGRSDDLMIGETVVAIGNPLGYQHTVTAGVVSAVGRDVEFGPEMMLRNLIQTDAGINPGNSGGPLLNVLGELIGVNTAVRGDAQNIGFAIPVDQLRQVLPELLDVQRRYRITSGMRLSNLGEPRILEVEPGSPAAEVGLRAGDLVIACDEQPVRQGMDVDFALIGRKPGDVVALRVQRDGRPVQARLRLGARPAPDGLELARQKLGLDLHPLPEEVARQLGLPNAAGLLVVKVEPGGPADRIGLERRDVLLSLGRYPLSTLEDLGQLLESAPSGEEIPLALVRVDRRGKGRLMGRIKLR